MSARPSQITRAGLLSASLGLVSWLLSALPVCVMLANARSKLITDNTVFWYAGRARSGDLGGIKLPQSEAAKLMTDHVPASLHFSDISYTLGNRKILDGISGCVKPGQVMAIMGASGAGKSTFLDILARKDKRGTVTGTTLVNGREVSDSEFRKVVGYVDQEDTLMPTLTAYETVLYSALLRLPREMSLEAKRFRTLETMQELGILGIKDMTIGSSGGLVLWVIIPGVNSLRQVIVPSPVVRSVVFLSLASSSRAPRSCSSTNRRADWTRITRTTSWNPSLPSPVITTALLCSLSTSLGATSSRCSIISCYSRTERSYTPANSRSATTTLSGLASLAHLASISLIT